MDSKTPQVLHDKGLKTGAIGAVSATVIGVASTAPAYSLAATLGLIAVIVGVASPAIILVAFIPMLFTASAYYYLNRSTPTAGHVLVGAAGDGPVGGMDGRMGRGRRRHRRDAQPGVRRRPVHVHAVRPGQPGRRPVGAAGSGCASTSRSMTWLTWLGIELSARTQFGLLGAEIFALVVFCAVALIKVYANHPVGSVTPSWSWLNPFALSAHQLSAGVLVTLFIYWGWDTAANVNEETRDSTRDRDSRRSCPRSSCWDLPDRHLRRDRVRGRRLPGGHPDDVLTAMGRRPWVAVGQAAGDRGDDLGDRLRPRRPSCRRRARRSRWRRTARCRSPSARSTRST